MRFASIVGARPQFVKVALVSKLLRQQHDELIIHTGQHYDYALSTQFFNELEIPKPDYYLDCGSASHAVQTARMLIALGQVLAKEQIDWVIVYGDTNSTLAAALVAAKLHIPIAHIEAGLRSFNRTMPEEINRIVTDHLSSRLFCPTESARQQAHREGLFQGVEFVGDVMYDMLLQVHSKLEDRIKLLLPKWHVAPQQYILTTVHRAVNTDDRVAMDAIAQALNKIEMPVIFPLHPRTQACLHRYDIQLNSHIQLIEPVGYLDMLALQRAAYRIITDSGGIQKEAFLQGVPCVTLRDETEWVETVQSGWNVLVGTQWQRVLEALARPAPPPSPQNPFGRGDAGVRIVQSWQG
jgi:UDP-GlcNAc3NAcA epimerase